VSCEKTVYEQEKVRVDGIVFHKSCFRCKECQCVLKLGNYAAVEGVYYCKAHFKQLFKLKGNYSEGFGKQRHATLWTPEGSPVAARRATHSGVVGNSSPKSSPPSSPYVARDAPSPLVSREVSSPMGTRNASSPLVTREASSPSIPEAVPEKRPETENPPEETTAQAPPPSAEEPQPNGGDHADEQQDAKVNEEEEKEEEELRKAEEARASAELDAEITAAKLAAQKKAETDRKQRGEEDDRKQKERDRKCQALADRRKAEMNAKKAPPASPKSSGSRPQVDPSHFSRDSLRNLVANGQLKPVAQRFQERLE